MSYPSTEVSHIVDKQMRDRDRSFREREVSPKYQESVYLGSNQHWKEKDQKGTRWADPMERMEALEKSAASH